jgi:TPR repeat protein
LLGSERLHQRGGTLVIFTSILLIASLAGSVDQSRAAVTFAPDRSTETNLSSGRGTLKADCKTFDKAVVAMQTGFVSEGVTCMQAAARRGEPLALRALGLMRLRGEVLGKDEQEAVALFHQAARIGDAESMYLLGEAFKRGIGVAPDQQLARFWLDRAAAEGYEAPHTRGR